jgi:hypothetical protein
MLRLEAFQIELDNFRNALAPDLKANCMCPQTFDRRQWYFANLVRVLRPLILL